EYSRMCFLRLSFDNLSTVIAPSPCFAKRSNFNIKGPGRSILVHHVPDLVRDRGRLDKEIVRGVGESFARPLEIDYRVDQHVGYMHALWPQFSRDRFGEDSLCGLGPREAGEPG